MIFSELKEMAQKDLSFKEDELDFESLRIPQLHGKYLNFLTDEKIFFQKLKFLIFKFFLVKLKKQKMGKML